MKYLLEIAAAISQSNRDEILHKLAHDQETEFEREISELTSEEIDKILSTIFPNAIPINSDFYNLVEEIQYYVGFKPLSTTLISGIWVHAYNSMVPVDQKKLLQSLLNDHVGGFWSAIHALPEFCSQIKLEPAFASTWFLELAKRVKDDLAGGDVFKAIGEYAFHHPEIGLKVFEVYISGSLDELSLSLAAILLGTVRSRVSHDQVRKESVNKWDNDLQNNPKTTWRLCYYRSLISSFDLGTLTIDELNDKLSKMLAGTPEEVSEAFNTVYHCLLGKLTDRGFVKFALDWFSKNVSSNISDMAKYYVVSSMWRLCNMKGNELKLIAVADANKLLVAVQPIPKNNLGTWRQLEYFLVDRLRENLQSFEDIFTSLVAANSEGLSAILQEDQFSYLKSEMPKYSIETILTNFVLSPDSGKRMIGNLLFQQLKIETLSQEALSKADESQLWIILLEFIRKPLIAEKVSSYLLSIEPYFSQAGLELKKEFKDEMVMQAVNYPGACLVNWKKMSSKSDLIKEVIKTAEGYFENINKTKESPALSFSFTGYRKASETQYREFSNKITKGAQEKSIFFQLVKNVQIIYGSRWSILTENSLGEDTAFSELSTSMEFPRLEIIDPEGMALGRLRAATKLRKLGKNNVDT